MIAAVGCDLVDVSAFAEQLADGASRFAEGTFTGRERDAAARRPSGDPTRHLAARFAAKEAYVKALSGSRFGRAPLSSGLDLRQVEVVSDAWGRPRLRLHADAAKIHARAGLGEVHLSLSHDGGVAMAFVTIEVATRVES